MYKKQFPQKKLNSSWNNVANWYAKKVGSGESYFHSKIVIPKVLKLLDLKKDSTLLDLACGEGVLSRSIPQIKEYLGIDLAEDLIKSAERQNRNRDFKFKVSDVSGNLKLPENKFTHAAVLLALQNIENVDGVIKNLHNCLKPKAKVVLVLNHPSFRIPRQSGWEINLKSNIQYRWVNRYYSEFKIPIDMTPGSKVNKKFTWSFHRPLEFYSKILFKHGFYIDQIEEWISEKHSLGKAAQMENFARAEFPMFMAMVGVKK